MNWGNKTRIIFAAACGRRGPCFTPPFLRPLSGLRSQGILGESAAEGEAGGVQVSQGLVHEILIHYSEERDEPKRQNSQFYTNITDRSTF